MSYAVKAASEVQKELEMDSCRHCNTSDTVNAVGHKLLVK